MVRLNNKLKFNNKIRQSLLFPFVLYYFGLTIPDKSEPIN
jgi:hypothetical protein